MAPDVQTINRDPDLEWLDLIRPTGLVLSPTVIKERGLIPERQTAADSAALAACLSEEGPALPESWRLVAEILGWDAGFVAGAPGGPALPDDLAFAVPEHDTTLFPDWAVQGFGEDAPWQLLVHLEPAGLDPDRRGEADGWEATPHQRFERLLRETGVLVGVLISDHELRLIYAPKGETSGWLAFPLRSLGTVAGRPMLAGLKLALGRFRLFNAPADQRLRALLKASRDAQAAVSTELSAQVLGALHELLRGLNAAEPSLIQNLAERRPDHLYEGLLTVLLRLVFILYAEDRDLLPSATDGASRALYEQSYSVRGLYAKLAEDDALNPDTMDERLGGWGRLLALFRLIHKGHRSGFIRARRGKLFDPDVFPFLEGRGGPNDPPRVVKLSDGCLLRILEGLMTLADPRTKVRQLLSYRTLDVEQIGSVYETIMGFTVQTAPRRVLAIKAGKHNRTPVFAELERLAALKPADRGKYLKDVCKREGALPKAVATALSQADDADGVAAALDSIADERGSPRRSALGAGTPILQPTEERRRTGSHYTPRDLTEPIVRHALRPVLERLGADATPAQILDLKVCDPAMGSGAFLVEACRQLAERLTEAWARHPGTRPPIPADEDEDLLARRLVAQRCLYGVDKNPMAVDLARLSLWLATLARDHEFTFLDHALKPGDSLVGLDLDQIEALHWDAPKSDAQLSLTRLLVRDRLGKMEAERRRIREAVEDASEDDLRPILLRAQAQLADPKLLGDAVIAAFFKGAKAKEREAVRAEVQAAVEMGGPGWRERLAPLTAGLTVTPFHWPLEFPEVFARANGGFDTVIGNPPFAGKNTLVASHPDHYPDWLQTLHSGAHGNSDLVAHFFRRAFHLLRRGGALGLIATNTIRQGDTRATGLRPIRDEGGTIYHAQRRIKWPGEAAVVIATVHIHKDPLDGPYLLDDRQVERITAFLFHAGGDADPTKLAANTGKSFQGSIVLGMGFTFDDQNLAKGSTPIAEMHRLIEENRHNAERIFPYIGGEEVNSRPNHAHHRYVINFEDMSEDEARCWPNLMAILEVKVRPVRATDNRKAYRDHWWRFAERQAGLGPAIAPLDRVLVISRVGEKMGIAFMQTNAVFAESLVIFAFDTHAAFGMLQSRVHEVWARFFASSLEDRLRYTPSDCFETFPFPPDFEGDPALEAAGEAYYGFRAQLMVARDKGLTKTYNDFHDRRLRNDPEIHRLRELHHTMDQAVLRTYGWDDLAAAAAPVFLDEENEDEFAYQGRLFWPSDFRDEVLARLLALNAERHADEVRRGIAPRQSARGQATEGDAEDEEDAA
ncbi:MAG: Eco57I restriction-modification methylase domain-containing protein [Geminicoccaceae bacterium]